MFLSKGRTDTKNWNRDRSKGHLGTAPPGDPSFLQTPNQTLLVNMCLLTGSWCGSSLGGPASNWPIQMWMFEAKHQAELRESSGLAGRRTRGMEGGGGCNPTRRTTRAGWTTQCSQRLDHQSRSVQGRTHGSRYLCSRERLCLTAVQGEALGLVEVWCTRLGGC